MNFENMNLIQPLLTAVAECGYDEPTPIQRETIPPVLEGRDVLGCAQTGTGKTAAFALPILQRLHEERKQHIGKRTIRALVLTPTRELAMQIYENFVSYGKRLQLRSCVIFGGVSQYGQVQQLRNGIDILVATPGRLNDLIGQGFIKLDHLEIFVLDEADRMLDMGFIHDVRKVIALLPEKRQTLFFSATMPAEVEKLTSTLLTNPVTVKVDPVSSTVDAIKQSLYMVDKMNKRLLLADLLHKPEIESALVFTRTKHGADRVVRELESAHIVAKAIHGDKSQAARQQALAEFKSGRIRVMIATDIAARGIDIAGLSHVINYDLPNEPEAYIHRIGRTGRAGMEGSAISFCCIDEIKDLKAIEKLIRKQILRMECPWPMEVFVESIKVSRQPRASIRGEAVAARGARQSMNDRGTRQTAADRMERAARRPSAQSMGRRGGAELDMEQNVDRPYGRPAHTARRGTEGAGHEMSRSGERRRGEYGAPARSHGMPARQDSANATGNASGAGATNVAYARSAGVAQAASSGRFGASARSESPARAAAATHAARFGASAHAGSSERSSAMHATPLERPTHASSPRSASSHFERSSERDSGHSYTHEPAQEQRPASRRVANRPIPTGDDRR